MAKLTRVTQPIFASDAAVNETSVFGTMKTSAQYTAKGWSDAVELDYAPYMEDMNTVQRAVTYQIAYNQQEGIPEWASDTTYYKGSWTKYNATNGAQIYESLVDNNTGNLVSDTTKWKLVYDTANSAITSIVGSNLTASRALVSNSSGKVAVSAVTATELGYLDGVTSAIQTQINAKAADNAVVHLSGNETITGSKTFSTQIIASAGQGVRFNGTDHHYVMRSGGSPSEGCNLFLDNDTTKKAFSADASKITIGSSAIPAYANVPSGVTTSTNNEQIATCGWVNTVGNRIVHTSGTETIGGTKTFSSAAYGTASDAANSILTTVNKSKSANGYYKLGNGLIIQWFSIGTGTNFSVTFPTPFSSATSYSIASGTMYNSGGETWALNIKNRTSTGFTGLLDGRYDGAMCIAIGY